MTRYELSYADGLIRLRFVDDDTEVFQDYVFDRKEFEDFSDAMFITLVETHGLTDHG